MKRLLVLAALLVAAAASRHEVSEEPPSERICAPMTPCGWQAYNPVTKEVQVSLRNTYCICTPDQHCGFHVDDKHSKTYVFRCFDGEGEPDKRLQKR